jgi:hypothetical protein
VTAISEHPAPSARDPLTTKEGWQRFIEHAPTAPNLVGWQAWRRLDDQTRQADIQARLDYHARLVVVATPTIRQVTHTGRRLVLLNHGQISARRGLIVTGAAGTGKTTAITQLGRAHELTARRQHAGVGPFLPVVYVTVPPNCTAKMLAAEFARFLGLLLPKSFSQVNITNAVCDVLCRLGTELVLVDELHNLHLATRNGAETSDQLKYLSERLPATFVLAGLNVEDTGLFAGVRGRQIAGRFATIPTGAFAYGTRTQHDWQALIATLEQALRLHRHPPGSLLGHAAYLHQRTNGMIGSLSHLIREAAIQAILDGSEQLNRATLDTVTLDHAAEHTRPARPATRRRPRAPRAGEVA